MLNFLLAILFSFDESIKRPIQSLKQVVLSSFRFIRFGQSTELEREDCERGEGGHFSESNIYHYSRNALETHSTVQKTFQCSFKFAEGMLVSDKMLDILAPTTSFKQNRLVAEYSKHNKDTSSVSHENYYLTSSTLDFQRSNGHDRTQALLSENERTNSSALVTFLDSSAEAVDWQNGGRPHPLTHSYKMTAVLSGCDTSSDISAHSSSAVRSIHVDNTTAKSLLTTKPVISTIMVDLQDFKSDLVTLATTLNDADMVDNTSLENRIILSRLLNDGNTSELGGSDVVLEDETSNFEEIDSGQDESLYFAEFESIDKGVDSIKESLQKLFDILGTQTVSNDF